MFKNISLFLLLSFVFVPPASADFLGIGGWTEKNITKPLKRKVIDPVVKETKHQMQVVRRGKLYKGADKLVQEGRNSKAYKAADKVLVSASRAVKNDCTKALTTAFTPLVGAVCGKVTTAALGGCVYGYPWDYGHTTRDAGGNCQCSVMRPYRRLHLSDRLRRSSREGRWASKQYATWSLSTY